MASTSKKPKSPKKSSPRCESPLAEIADALDKMPKEKRPRLQPPSPELVKLRKSIAKVFALQELLAEHKHASWPHVRTRPDALELNLFWFDFGVREPYETFALSSGGRVRRHACQYSGHNGSSYDDQYEDLEGPRAQAAVNGMLETLERLALAAEERRLEEAAQRRRSEAAKANLAVRLRGKGIHS